MVRRRPALHSLSRRLTVAMVALVGASLLLADFGAVYFLRSVLVHNLQRQLVASAHSTADFYLHTGAVPARLPLGESIAIYGDNGHRAFVVGSAPEKAPPLGVSQQARSLRYTVDVPGGYLFEAVNLTPVTRPVHVLEGVLALVTLAAVLLAAILADRVAHSLTAPLSSLSAEAARISETGDLETSLPKDHGVQEIRDLAVALQHMLERLGQMFGALEASEQRERALREMTLHDLRTPLSTVLGTLELLAGGRLTGSEAVEAAGLAQREAARLAARIRDLDATEGEACADLAQAVRRAARGHTLSPGPDPAWVAAPAAELGQVLDLLADNAVRHNPPGTRVDLGWSLREHEAVAYVADEGVGMTEEAAAHAFDRFYRGDELGGLGLGLALARVLVESRGGTIALATAPGQGTTVTVHWPRAAAPKEAGREI